MKISYNWLTDYISNGDFAKNDEAKAHVAAKLLTDCGLEVESAELFESLKGGLKGVVIGEVMEKQKHPNADKLSLTKVNVGGDALLSIVCGAPNVEAGQKVAVALVGATLHPLSGEPFEIKKSKIRGELSEGMICAEDEIGLGASHAGIMVLDAAAQVGTPAADYFKVEKDIVFEIGLTPNRADAASHIGVARDLAAVVNSLNANPSATLKLPSVDDFKVDNTGLIIKVEVENKNDCIRYSGVSISGVEVKDSPEWLKNKLKSIGLKSINNVVDVTNFVLFETGQPLHAFNADKITGQKIIVKNLPAKTKFVTLDGVERELNGSELMICNSNEGMCMAGIFGGMHSGVSSQTTNIFLESACFHPGSIRKSSKQHGLKTDASFRFERGTDPDITVYALKRAALLLKEICGGKIASEIVDIYPQPVQPATVQYNFKSAARLSGIAINATVTKNILTDLGIQVAKENTEDFELIIPNYKVDVKREVDVVEEVLRIYGYNRIDLPAKMNMPLPQRDESTKEALVYSLSAFLVANGFNEMLSNSLTKESYATVEEKNTAVKIINPLSNELSIMRQSLLFSGLEAIQYNRNRKKSALRFFEFGKSYHKTSGGYSEPGHLSLFVTGSRYAESWVKQQPSAYDIYFMKSLLHNLLVNAGVQEKNISHRSIEQKNFSSALEIIVGNKVVATYGLLNGRLQKQFDITEAVFYADVLMDTLVSLTKSAKIVIAEVPKFPEVKRDLSMLIGKNISYADIEKLAFETERKLLKNVHLFDVYQGDKIDIGKTSYAISFILRDDEKTLQDKQIEGVMDRLMKTFEAKLGAQIRK